MSIKQVIVLRTKFPDGRGGTMGMRLGKIGAQIAHASEKVFFDRATKGFITALTRHQGETASSEDIYLDYGPNCLVIPLTPDMASWVNGMFTKIVLGVDTEEELLAVHEAAKAAGLPTALIQDMGATEFGGVPTFTTVAIGPADAIEIDKITRDGNVKCRLL